MENKRTLQIFCANCQTETPHTGEVDLNGELVFTCQTEGCGRFIKVPAGMTAEEIHAHFADHKEANVGQVSVAASHAALEDVFAIAGVSSEEPTEEETPAEDAEEPAEA